MSALSGVNKETNSSVTAALRELDKLLVISKSQASKNTSAGVNLPIRNGSQEPSRLGSGPTESTDTPETRSGPAIPQVPPTVSPQLFPLQTLLGFSTLALLCGKLLSLCIKWAEMQTELLLFSQQGMLPFLQRNDYGETVEGTTRSKLLGAQDKGDRTSVEVNTARRWCQGARVTKQKAANQKARTQGLGRRSQGLPAFSSIQLTTRNPESMRAVNTDVTKWIYPKLTPLMTQKSFLPILDSDLKNIQPSLEDTPTENDNLIWNTRCGPHKTDGFGLAAEHSLNQRADKMEGENAGGVEQVTSC
ncbi:hypothetical protein GH733_005509 [Mirounga leonina]|nr:hypothetical protein GH733_005509 [Mirounga leonina]